MAVEAQGLEATMAEVDAEEEVVGIEAEEVKEIEVVPAFEETGAVLRLEETKAMAAKGPLDGGGPFKQEEAGPQQRQTQ